MDNGTMCLAIPCRVAELLPGDQALVEVGGVRKPISLALVEDVRVGDCVILHVGFALSKLDPEEAGKTLALFAEMGITAEATAQAAAQLEGRGPVPGRP
jgi:hydrogenase expression/formation protein HypC